MNLHYRYSPEFWPNAALPIPLVARYRRLLDESGWLVPDDDVLGVQVTSPPPEMHLREMRDVDWRDPESIREMCESTGDMIEWSRPWAGVTGRAMPDIADGLQLLQAQNIAKQLNLPSPDGDRPEMGIHVAEVANRLVLVRAMVDHLERALAEESTAPVWQRCGAFDFDNDWDQRVWQRRRVGMAPIDDESPEVLAWYYFTQTLNDGLTGVSPRVTPPPVEAFPELDLVVDAYTAACVLIFNDLQQGTPYRRCADETCGRLFARQLGRSTGSFSRSEGVAYCSPTHARNQSQRERRRRQRAAKSRTED